MSETLERTCEYCDKVTECLFVQSLGSYLCFDCRKKIMSPNLSALQLPPSALREPTDNVSLTKNTKGYNWEIKLQSIDLKRLREINEELLNTYGG
jgi:hypothetical protein